MKKSTIFIFLVLTVLRTQTQDYLISFAGSGDTTGVTWGCDTTLIGGTSSGIGTGQANTTTIVNGCSQTGIAARICDDLVLNGYIDWFLPSMDELNQVYYLSVESAHFSL
jgi:hypothetical protein